MDNRLRRIYREYGGNSLEFLINCSRAGLIPPDAAIELSLLPEMARYTDMKRVRVSNLSSREFSQIHDYYKNRQNSTSILGELVANYVLTPGSSWTLYGNSLQDLIDRFRNSPSLSRNHLTNIFEDPAEDQVELERDLYDAIIASFDGDVEDLQYWLDGRGYYPGEGRQGHNAHKVVRLIWGVQGSMVEAVVRIIIPIESGTSTIYITLIGTTGSLVCAKNYEGVVSVSNMALGCSGELLRRLAPPIWTDHMVLASFNPC
jgi:hypothetical protein